MAGACRAVWRSGVSHPFSNRYGDLLLREKIHTPKQEETFRISSSGQHRAWAYWREGGLCKDWHAHADWRRAYRRWLPRDIFIAPRAFPSEFGKHIFCSTCIDDFFKKEMREFTETFSRLSLRFSHCGNIQRGRIRDDLFAMLEKLYLEINRIGLFHIVAILHQICRLHQTPRLT